jgi:thiol-disulfide isomerase/thioredoxin
MLPILVWGALATAAVAAAQGPGSVRGGDRERVPVLGAKDFHLKALEGRVVLVDFWSTKEELCRQSLPWLSTMQSRYGDQGLTVVAVNVDREANEARELFDMLDPKVQVVLDPRGAMAASYEVAQIPSGFLYGRNQELRATRIGFDPEEAAAREKEIVDLLAEKVK